MPVIEQLRRQHGRILSALQSLGDCVDRRGSAPDLFLGWTLLVRTALVHLACERAELLPMLAADASLRDPIARASAEADALQRLLEHHERRYPSVDDVRADPTGFAAACREVDALLRDRIAASTEALYDPAQRHGTRNLRAAVHTARTCD